MASTIKSYRDLQVWQLAMKLAQLCYEHTAHFPARETYGLASQIRRAAVSVASNIAEGHGRRTLQAYLNHLSIALGSQSELETQIELSRRLNLLPEESAEEILQMPGRVGRMLHRLIQSLEQKGGSSPQRPAPSPQHLAPSTQPTANFQGPGGLLAAGGRERGEGGVPDCGRQDG